MSKNSTSINYIDLESVGSTVTKEGMVFPIDIYEIPETASDAEELMGVNIFELDSEWIGKLSSDDLIELISFLDNHMAYDLENPSQIHYGYTEWRTNTWSLWEQVNNCFMNLAGVAIPVTI